MLRLLTALVLCGIAHTAFTMHMQVGASGFSDISGSWTSGTAEVGCATGGIYLASYGVQFLGNSIKLPGETYSRDNFMRLGFVPNDGTIFVGRRSRVYFSPVECYTADRIDEWANMVVTLRGDPCSPVFNDTRTGLTVNNMFIKPGETAMLPFPLELYINSAVVYGLYDLDTGEQLTPTYTPTYSNGTMTYRLYWSGGIRIADPNAGSRASIEPLIYSDTTPTNLLYAANGNPIFATPVTITTNIMLQTWWDFSSYEWGGSPKAYVNDTCVCDGHSTSHIISYVVSTEGMMVYSNGKGYGFFTMSQTPESGYSGGSCTMRCWDASLGSDTSAYANAPADHRAAVSAGTGVARFKLTIDIYAGTWKVEPN